jgi:hypothetical protein
MRSQFFTGLIVLFVGIVVLLGNFGLLPSNVISQLWKLWPVILIIYGINMIKGRGCC